MITAGNILYSYINFNYLPKADLLEDKVLREFTLKLKETTRQSIIDNQVFNGISPIGMSLESLKNEVAVSYLKHKINDNYKRQLNSLTTGDFNEESIVRAFPEIADSDLLDLPRAISAKDLPIEEVKFKPFYSEWDRVFSGLINTDYVLIYGLTGTGKCHGKGVEVIMYDGSLKKVEDVTVGDLLMGDDSQPRKVLNVVRGKDKLYKVNQENGDSYTVNSEHILSLKGSTFSHEKTSKYHYGNITDISIKDYLKENKSFKKLVKGYKVGVEFKDKPLPLDPYLLGVWLGDGTSANSQITLGDKDSESIIQYISNIEGIKVNLFNIKDKKGSKTFNIAGDIYRENHFLNFLRDHALINNKHIPFDFKTCSRQQRLLLLAGLLDTDGYNDADKSYEITQKNKSLANDIVFLCRSLGFRCTMRETVKKCQNDFSIYISGDNLNTVPMQVERKKIKEQNKRTFQDLTKINVEYIEEGDYYGFELDGNHRYLLADFTVTHNSSIQSRIIADAIKRKIKVASYQTEMSLSQSRIYIYGSFLDLIPHEATAYFEDKRDELLYLNSKLGEYLILPSQNSFNWTTFEKLFESDAEIIFLDQISSALGQMGKIENEANVAEFSKKVQALVMKYKKPVFVNHQETFRTATAAELEKKPDQQFVGLQTPRYASSVLMDLTLALLIRKNETNQRTIQITKDRFRGIASLDSFYCDINNKTGQIEGDIVKSKRVMDKLSQVDVRLTLKELGF